MEKRLLTISGFMYEYGVGSRTGFYQLVHSGRLKTVKSGRRRLVPREAAEEYKDLLQREAEEAQ